jgi:AraC-like DNA-binding protein
MASPLASLAPRVDRSLGPDARVRLWSFAGGRVDAPRPGGHREVEVTCVLAGQVGYGIGARELRAGTQQAVLVPAQAEHVTRFDGPLEAIALWVAPEAIAEAADAVGRPHAQLRDGSLATSAAVPRLLQILEGEIRDPAPGSCAIAEAVVDATIVALLRDAHALSSTRRVVSPKIRRTLERIHAEYAAPLGAAGLAKELGMSRFAFSRSFREQVGLPPCQYLLQTRLDRAAEQLRSGRRAVAEVALTVGFVDHGRFSRMFRRRFGCVPSEFAARVRR